MRVLSSKKILPLKRTFLTKSESKKSESKIENITTNHSDCVDGSEENLFDN